MSPEPLPEGTDTILDSDGAAPDLDIDTSGAAAMDSGAEADAIAAGGDAGEAATAADDSSGSTAAGTRDAFRDAKDKAGQKAQDFKGQATDKLRSYAVGGKDKASESIQGFAKLLEDAAAQVDDKVGGQYGDYARQAAQRLTGLATTLDGKDVDDLFDQGRDLVRRSPGIALGAAAALGFVVARLARSGVDAATDATTGVRPGDGPGRA